MFAPEFMHNSRMQNILHVEIMSFVWASEQKKKKTCLDFSRGDFRESLRENVTLSCCDSMMQRHVLGYVVVHVILVSIHPFLSAKG